MQATKRKVSQRASSSREAPQQAPPKTRVQSNFEAAVVEVTLQLWIYSIS